MVSGDDIGGSFSGTFENKNIGTGKTVTISSSYSGVDSGNYSVTDQSSTTANITTRALSVSGLTASNKTYDATTSATLDTSSVSYAGLVSGDSFSGSYTGTFNDANVGASKLVTISSSYSGNDINNYSITGQSSTGADITKASPTISGLSNQSKYSDENYTLAGVPSISGLSISYSSDDTNVANVDSSTGAVSILTTGTSAITASIAATSNYNAATASYILTISTRPVNSGSPSQVAADSAIRTTTSSASGTNSSNGTTNVGSDSYAGSSINNSAQVVSFSAKVVVLRPEQTPKAEGVYEFNNEESKLDDIANDSEGFQKLGEVIGITEYSIEIKADDLYNYTLEVRDGGILIKPSNQKSLIFAENYRTKVIDTAMEEVEKNFGIPSFQIRTIVLDFYKRYTQAN